MSPREQVQSMVAGWITDHRQFNAPYGVLEGLQSLKSGGKVRTITFGICRTLDATLFIFSPTNLKLHTSQGDWSFKSVEEFQRHCAETWGVK